MAGLLFPVSLVGFAAALWLVARRVSRARSLPPGPKGLPIIGDIFHIADPAWLASPQRKDEYGEMMYVSALGQGILVINSQRVAIDLLEKRSSIHSDRPKYICAGEILTRHLELPMTPYGSLWRRLRRIAVEGYSKSVVPDLNPIQGREALILALALIKNPSNTEKQLQRHGSSIMMSVNYNLPPIESEDDPIIVGIMEHVKRLMHETRPGTRLVEFFPWMKYIPNRFAKWKRDAEYWYAQDTLTFERFLSKVTNELASGIDRPCFAASVIQSPSKHDLSQHEQAWLVGGMLVAGSETTATALQWWLLAMIAYPATQVRAHAELDEIVGTARPPTFADLPSLPYIRAMVKETLRWAPIVPLGVPHASTADDWYEGTYIPKGTLCVQNMRAINREPEVFGPDAEEFEPARYMEHAPAVRVLDGREEGHMAFGFGRRICPGRYVAEATLAIDFATLLWAMRFERLEGSRGELDVRSIVGGSITAHPVPFEYKAVPRFAEAEGMLRDALDLYK